MAWEQRPRGNRQKGYFYKSVRVPGRRTPVKMYLGTGPEAEAEAARMAENLRRKAADKAAVDAAEQSYARCDAMLAELTAWTDALVAAYMVLTGHHYHRGSWRRTRGRRTDDGR